jgi:hypothetical protein
MGVFNCEFKVQLRVGVPSPLCSFLLGVFPTKSMGLVGFPVSMGRDSVGDWVFLWCLSHPGFRMRSPLLVPDLPLAFPMSLTLS